MAKPKETKRHPFGTQKGDVQNFKKFTTGRCMTLFNKAYELYNGYTHQGYDAHICVLIKDGERRLVFTSDADQWPFDFQRTEVQDGDVFGPDDLEPGRLSQIMRQKSQPKVIRRRKSPVEIPSGESNECASNDEDNIEPSSPSPRMRVSRKRQRPTYDEGRDSASPDEDGEDTDPFQVENRVGQSALHGVRTNALQPKPRHSSSRLRVDEESVHRGPMREKRITSSHFSPRSQSSPGLHHRRSKPILMERSTNWDI